MKWIYVLSSMLLLLTHKLTNKHTHIYIYITYLMNIHYNILLYVSYILTYVHLHN